MQTKFYDFAEDMIMTENKKILCSTDNAKDCLLNDMKNAENIDTMLHLAYRILENPVVVFDTSYNLLAHTANTVSDDMLWNELIGNGRFSHSTVDGFNRMGFIKDVSDAEPVITLTNPLIKYDRILGKLFDRDGIHIGNILTLGCYRPFKPADLICLEKICKRISDGIQKNNILGISNKVFNDIFISDLLNAGDGISEYDINNLYKDLNSNIFLGIIDICQYERTLTHLAYFKDLFKEIQNEHKYFIYLNNIIMLISGDGNMPDTEKHLGSLSKFFSDYEIYAGISDGFQNLFDVQKYYQQALAALNFGLASAAGHAKQYIFTFGEFRLEYFLSRIKNDVDISDLCLPIMQIINEYDKDNNTAYSSVIYTYLASKKDLIKTAEILDIPTDIIKETLGDIKKLFSIDLISVENNNLELAYIISHKILNFL
jgi:hypothetical protein